ncbi:MAG TPA: sulfite exporter TauE/SafE family protein [Chryseolinea sp.]|nr:sulfite exporter TauE/SafE family protein [Chryseolinea sp.]
MVVTALLMGFAGSLHCAGMCSPLVMAVSNLTRGAIVNRVVYNMGRILTYALLGGIVGTAGWALPFSNFQNLLSVVMGISLLIFAVLNISSVRIPLVTNLFQRISIELKEVFKKVLQRKSFTSIFLLGTINGMLPCGLTFLALSYCLTLNGPIDSFYFMLLFGVGTLPIMLGATSFLGYLVKRFNLNFTKVTTTMLFVTGCLLIVRVFLFHQPHALAEEGVIDIILCR